MKIRVLGSAAGGGFPQWNCNCRNCAGLRNGSLRARARTQSSIAVSGRDLTQWALVNASPDILAQLKANPVLQPARAPRDTAIAAVVLVDAQIDHSTGLFMLRESSRPLEVWCTDPAHEDLTHGNPIFRVLSRTVFSTTATMEKFLVELGTHLGVTTTVEPALPMTGSAL